ncbi:ABC transporter ATP-binding protein [Gemmiger sp.]|uniref:ABC transporter ATP-binding protein n=1 Tax=Gemmiger sp. TaxID=2049027 RepID=UPI0025E67AFF|nr:ABC transporter ATP-binding protein [Gemmiger sp.]MBD8953413.1 ABC transporter ATP-binding protein [Subdoligranulum sp.]MCI6384516.1 ABC transporter ATP-binding protein [Subdoligranulum variabile]MDD6425343.1 ABC transporter ATP-binding protein [Subdoligranulum variabile]MDD6609336.1 ABC transporter ATP-binding protein [Subdoligranulum variabile]MDD6649690.1 ABC transporter ATP-binding protein [Subdoligranulum variabile]
MAQTEYAVRLQHVTKTFGPVVANKDVSLGVRRGEILALLGENGSGKTTLMNMIAGIYYPDEGEIYVGDKVVTIRSPRDALDLGIGMIHQHFKLVDVFTAAENIALSMGSGKYDLKKVQDKARAICEKYQFALDLNQKVYEMSVSQKQTLEIVKVLYRGADILILDEPTAVLTPQETERLFTVIRNMKADGKAVIIITHKLHEVLSISDRVAILRKGEYVGDITTKDADESTLTAMMVGEKVELNIDRPEPVNPVKRLDIQHLTVRSPEGITVLDDASFDVYGGEILGIAGISGNGQKELLEAIAGLQPTQRGASVEYYAPDAAPVQLIGKSPKAIREAGIHLSFVPEDRLGMGLVGSMGMTDNMMLKSYGKGHSPIVDRKAPHDLAETIKKELNVVTPDLNTPVSRLSGGNVQKVLVGRELAADPIVLMTAYAVRGLDINTSYTIYHLLNEQKKKGVAVIYVGEDLDVLLELCDRIVVLCGGKVNGILDGRKTTKEEVGNRMTNLVKEAKA